eukprot:GEZU01017249.1.p1 GENE.GEZU01017249.1~~GEZU01017249.1.p1  ORF type:complete len:212 (+),score=69.36 GEZU01017249.1:307-942(+)
MGNTEEEKKKKIEIDVDSDSDSYDGGDSSDDEKPTSDSNDPSPMSSTRSKKLDINMISFRLRKNVGTKLATSSLGKTAIRRILPDEPRQLLACIKALAATQYGKKKAAQLEHYFIKIIIKSLFIFSFYGDDGESTTTTTTASLVSLLGDEYLYPSSNKTSKTSPYKKPTTKDHPRHQNDPLHGHGRHQARFLCLQPLGPSSSLASPQSPSD